MNAIFKRPFRIQVDEPKQKFKLFNKSSFPVPLPDHVAKNWFFQAKAKADAEAAAKAAEDAELAELEAAEEAEMAKAEKAAKKSK